MTHQMNCSTKRTEIRLRHFVLAVIFGYLIVGCSLTSPPPQDCTQDVQQHAPAEEIWRALANAVEARTIATSTRLAQFVVALARHGELSGDDVTQFDQAFPKITTGSRELTDIDVKTLIELGGKAKP
jgi:hypothetical protein